MLAHCMQDKFIIWIYSNPNYGTGNKRSIEVVMGDVEMGQWREKVREGRRGLEEGERNALSSSL